MASGGYTYWGFYSWDAAKQAWSYMKVGANDPTTSASKDGAVYGFRWALVVKDPRLPRAAGDFAQLCGGTPKVAGRKRIGFVVDYGTTADADGGTPPQPEGLCASVGESSTVQQALLSVIAMRAGSNGLICGIDGYPSTGCGSADKQATEPPADTPVALAVPGSATAAPLASGGAQQPNDSADASTSGSSNTGVYLAVGAVVLVALLVGAFVVRRRNA